MPLISNIPPAMLDEHEDWHTRPGNPSQGGRAINPWPPGSVEAAPGSGEEFLQWHSGYVARFASWVESLAADQRPTEASIRGWSTIPLGLKMGMVGWNATRAAQEDRLQNMGNFGSVDELGRFLEWGLHGFLHTAASAMHNEPELLSFRSPKVTYFWQLHGLIENWHQDWIASQQPNPPGPAEIPVGGSIDAAISNAGEVDTFVFHVAETREYVIETSGPTDTVLYLAGPNNPRQLLATNDDGGQARNARLSGVLEAASYVVYIVHYAVNQTGQYTISVT